MPKRPLTDVLSDGPRKKAASRTRLVIDQVHVRTGLPVRDATEGRYMTVTPADAATATKGDPQNCGFSMCARRTVPGLTDVEFYLSVAYFIYSDHVERYKISNSTQRALAAFDLTGMFAPGEYWLTAPAPSAALLPNATPAQREKIMAAVRKARPGAEPTIAQIATRTRIDRYTVRKVVRDATSRGLVSNISNDRLGRYTAGPKDAAGKSGTASPAPGSHRAKSERKTSRATPAVGTVVRAIHAS